MLRKRNTSDKGLRKAIKLEHFSNRSMHIESYIIKCFIDIMKLEPKRMKDENLII